MKKEAPARPDKTERIRRLKSRDEAQVTLDRKRLHPNGKKRCSKCCVDLDFSSFSRIKSNLDGLYSYCRSCKSKSTNPSRERAYRKELHRRLSERDGKQIETDRGDQHPSGRKRCAKCSNELDFSSFAKNALSFDGLDRRCRSCTKISRKRLKDRTEDAIERDCKRMRVNRQKLCSSCGRDLPLSEFTVARQNVDGLHPICKECSAVKYADNWKRCEALRNEKRAPGCIQCPEKRLRCIDLAHRNREEKLKDSKGRRVGPNMIRSLDKLKRELEFVDPLCASCHALQTQAERQVLTQARDRERGISSQLKRLRAVVGPRQDFVNSEKIRRGNCVDCKRAVVKEECVVFDFDHVKTGQKIAAVAKMTCNPSLFTLSDLALEMAKCELRCKNCHRIVTYERLQAKKAEVARAADPERSAARVHATAAAKGRQVGCRNRVDLADAKGEPLQPSGVMDAPKRSLNSETEVVDRSHGAATPVDKTAPSAHPAKVFGPKSRLKPTFVNHSFAELYLVAAAAQ